MRSEAVTPNHIKIMSPAAEPTPISWPQFFFTDPTLIGVLTWAGVIISVGGFWFGLIQLKKVSNSSRAAALAVSGMIVTVRRNEQSVKIIGSIDNLKMADRYLKSGNKQAAAAYLDVAWTGLIESREMTLEPNDQQSISKSILNIRRIYEECTSSNILLHISPDKNLIREAEMHEILGDLGTLSAKLRINLQGIGTNI